MLSKLWLGALVTMQVGGIASAATPVIQVEPQNALMDQTVRIRVSGIASEWEVTLRATSNFSGKPPNGFP
jgi:hypothetical protein